MLRALLLAAHVSETRKTVPQFSMTISVDVGSVFYFLVAFALCAATARVVGLLFYFRSSISAYGELRAVTASRFFQFSSVPSQHNPFRLFVDQEGSGGGGVALAIPLEVFSLDSS